MSAADGLNQLADRLYALPPADFVAARDDAVKAARASGDRTGAAAIAKLRRPTVAAWLVNLLAFERADRLDELFALGAQLRTAQHELRGPALRELANRRRAAVAALVSEAADLAVRDGAARSGLPVVEVEATLVAALADEALAESVRAGRLLKSGHYDGFGEMPRPQLQVIEGGAERPTPEKVPQKVAQNGSEKAKPEKAKPEKARPEKAGPEKAKPDDTARRRIEEAAATLAEAEAAYEAAVEAVDARTRDVADIEERLTQLRADRVAAHAALHEAQATQDSLDAARHAAKRSMAAADRAAKRN